MPLALKARTVAHFGAPVSDHAGAEKRDYITLQNQYSSLA